MLQGKLTMSEKEMKISNQILVFMITSIFYMNSSLAASCGGAGGGKSLPGYVAPTPSAADALDLLEAKIKPKPVTTIPTPETTAVKPPAVITPTKPQTTAGKIVWIKGTLKVVGADKQVRTVQVGSPIYPEDTIVTDGKSQAQVVFTDRTLLTLEKSTVFNVTHYDYHPEVKSGSVGKFISNLVVGTYRTITGAIPKANPSDYKVVTDVAVIGVAGTDYNVSFRACKIDMQRNSGKPTVENTKGKIILTQSSPYAGVTSADLPPVVLPKQPAVFSTPIPIIKTTFEAIPLSTGGSNGGGICSPKGNGFSLKFH